MPTSQHPFNLPRPSGRASRPARKGQVVRQPGPSRMALEQPDDTPLDQRLAQAPSGPRQMA
jgi:hypothetical protein